MHIDFLHIGLHKTASTFLQKKVFPLTDNLKVLNNLSPEIDEWFIKNFVNKDSTNFDKDFFLREFQRKITLNKEINLRSRFAISEENLSGEIYTGERFEELAERINEVFGNPHVLIILRNQVDFILSAYSNYVYHGGTKKFDDWHSLQLSEKMNRKLLYSNILNKYTELFSKEKIHILFYETLFFENSLNTFLKNFNLKLPKFNSGKVNQGGSIFGNHVLAYLNRIGLPKIRGRQQFRGVFPRNIIDRDKVIRKLGTTAFTFRADNIAFAREYNLNLPEQYLFNE